MQSYSKTITYLGTDILIDVIGNTGSVQTIKNGFEVSENTNSIRIRFDDFDEQTDGIKDEGDDGIKVVFNRLLQLAQDSINNVDDPTLDAIMMDLMFERNPGIAAPTGFVATTISSSAIDLSFNAVTGATEYHYESSLTDDFATINGQAYVKNNATIHVIGLTPNTQYFYRLQAYSTTDGYSNYVYAEATTNP